MTTSVTLRVRCRCYPQGDGLTYITTALNNARAAYNLLLEDYIWQIGLWQADPDTYPKPQTSVAALNRRLTLTIEHNPWLKTTLREALTQQAVNLSRAFAAFWKNRKAGKRFTGYYPRFKKRFGQQSFTVSGVQQMQSRIHPTTYRHRRSKKTYEVVSFTLPGCAQPLKIRWYRSLPSTPTTYSISREPDGRYYISFVVQQPPRLTHGQQRIGVDLGIKDLMVLSDGTTIPNDKRYLELDRRLKRLQRKHAKSRKKGKNREKLRLKIATLHRRLRHYSDHRLHTLSRQLVNDCQLIGFETLHIPNMVKNHQLARSILTANWGTFRSMVEYKAQESHWCNVVFLDPFFPSSKRCSACNHIYKGLTLAMRHWTCPACGSEHDRDGNAAVNILIEAARIEHQLSLEASPGKVAQSTGGRAHILHALPPQSDPRFIGLTFH